MLTHLGVTPFCPTTGDKRYEVNRPTLLGNRGRLSLLRGMSAAAETLPKASARATPITPASGATLTALFTDYCGGNSHCILSR